MCHLGGSGTQRGQDGGTRGDHAGGWSSSQHGWSPPSCSWCSEVSQFAGWPCPAEAAPVPPSRRPLPTAAGLCLFSPLPGDREAPLQRDQSRGGGSGFARAGAGEAAGASWGVPFLERGGGGGYQYPLSRLSPCPNPIDLYRSDADELCEAIDVPAALPADAGRQGMGVQHLTLPVPRCGSHHPRGSGSLWPGCAVSHRCPGTDGWLLSHACPSDHISWAFPCQDGTPQVLPILPGLYLSVTSLRDLSRVGSWTDATGLLGEHRGAMASLPLSSLPRGESGPAQALLSPWGHLQPPQHTHAVAFHLLINSREEPAKTRGGKIQKGEKKDSKRLKLAEGVEEAWGREGADAPGVLGKGSREFSAPGGAGGQRAGERLRWGSSAVRASIVLSQE